MLPTESSAERRLYEGFLSQLADEYVVYHSVEWVLAPEEPSGQVVQGECDFLIAHPEDGLLVLEAKAGGVSYDPKSRRWRQAGRGNDHVLDDPFRQARGEMDSLVEILEHEPNWERWRPSYGYGVALPDAIFGHDAYEEARADWAIDKDDMDRLADRVKEVMGAWRHRNRHFGRAGMEALQAALGIRVEVRSPLLFEHDEGDRRIVELTENQTYVLSYVRKLHRAAVVGPAGSGKTLLATQLAKRLAESGNETLLTCINGRLAEHLRETSGAVRHLIVRSFHELCTTLAEEAGIPVPPPPHDPDEAGPYFDVTLPGLLAEAAEKLGPRFDAMIVDEAQEFLPDWWPVLMKLHTHSKDGFLFLFADSNERRPGGSLPRDMVELSLPLPENMRNTKPIHEFVSVFYQGEGAPGGRDAKGPPVEVISYQEPRELSHLLVVVLKNLEDQGVPLKDIVLLMPDGAVVSEIGGTGELNGYRLSSEPGPGTLLTSTVRSFSGLERQVVILAGVGSGSDEELAKILYVGGSRARNHLIVLAEEPVAREIRQLAGISKP
jgi:Nuclease-related domain/AAA domain